MEHEPLWVRPLIKWLEEVLLLNTGKLPAVERLAAGNGFQETLTAIVSYGKGHTEQWFFRKVSSTSRWCTISGIYSALGIPTIKPIPFDDCTLVYASVEGVDLRDYQPETHTELLLFADALGEAFIASILTELGDRKPGNMILSKRLSGKGYFITHIDFDKSLYIPWYDKVIDRHRFIKYSFRRLALPWADQLNDNLRSAFLERITNSAERYLQALLRPKTRTPEDLKYNYLNETIPASGIIFPWDQDMLRFAYRQLAYWNKAGPKEIRRQIVRLL